MRPTFQTTCQHRRRRRRRRELPGDRPARLAPDHAQLAPQRPLVDLDDDAVDLVVELLAPLLPPVAALDDALDARVVLGVGIDLEAALAQPLDLVHVGGEVEAADGADPVDPDRERPFRGQRRVELADRAGGRVARVGEGRFPGLGPALVEGFEGGDRQVDLAPHFDQLGRVGDPQRHRADRAQVLGHVLADPAVAAGGPAHQHPVLVGERDRQAVDLRLGRVAELRGGDVEALQVVGQPRSPRPAAPPRCGRCRARASARGARPARSAPAAAPRPAGWASRACAAPGSRPRSRAARPAARRTRRRRSPGRRGRSRGGCGAPAPAAAPPPAARPSRSRRRRARRQHLLEAPAPQPLEAAVVGEVEVDRRDRDPPLRRPRRGRCPRSPRSPAASRRSRSGGARRRTPRRPASARRCRSVCRAWSPRSRAARRPGS